MNKGDETRAAILQAGLRSASLEGLDSLTIGKLAKAVGMSKSGLFGHFAAKESLQLAVLEHAAECFVQTVVAPALRQPRGEPRVRALFENWLHWRQRADLPGGCIFLAASLEFDDKPGAIRDFVVRSQRDWLDTLTTAVAIAQREGHFRSDLSPQQAAFELYGLTMGFHFFERLLADKEAMALAQRAFDDFLKRSRVAA